MKLEKAIEILEHNWTQIFNPFYKEEELNNALNMAIKTLKVHYCDRNKCLQMEYNGKGCKECEAPE